MAKFSIEAGLPGYDFQPIAELEPVGNQKMYRLSTAFLLRGQFRSAYPRRVLA